MYANYLTTFVRILMRQKIYSAINIFGLAVGISVALLIALYITDELSYDKFHREANRIFRNELYVLLNGEAVDYAESSGSVADFFRREISGVESVLRIRTKPVTPVSLGDKTVSLEKLIDADSNFFNFFSFQLIVGNQNQALKGANKIVLTQATAKSLFNASSASEYQRLIGKIILVGNAKHAMEVTGIAANPPSNSHFHFDSIISMETNDPIKEGTYFDVGNSIYTYIKTTTQATATGINSMLPNAIQNIWNSEFNNVFTLAEFRKSGNEAYFHLEPITSIHLGQPKFSEVEAKGNRQYLYLIGSIAAFVMVLACINFVNLSTARASNRAKEVGIRKTVGAHKQKLVTQFLMESLGFTFFALLAALALISLSLEPFNFLTNKNLSIQQLATPFFVNGIILLVIVIGLSAGGYPAFYLSRFKPALVLKGKLGLSQGNNIRNFLVVIQFSISVILEMATLLVYRQIDYLQTLSPGFDKENVIILKNTLNLKSNYEAFKTELKNESFVINVSYSNRVFSEIIPGSGARKLKGTNEFKSFKGLQVDEDFLSTMNLSMISGRFFSKEFPSDSNAVIINETGANLIGLFTFRENEKLEFINGSEGVVGRNIIGIVKDFNFESMKSTIGPLEIRLGGISRLSIRLKSGDARESVNALETIWKKYSAAPFEYSFLDQNLEKQYESEEKLAGISITLTALSIFIACLGLLGLVTYIASQRTKEIGIRKVMGASVQQIVVLLSKDFLRLVLIAFVIAIPVSWYGMNEWLKTFAYRIEFSFAAAVVAGCIVIIIALLTISYQSIRAAMGNPVENLRSE